MARVSVEVIRPIYRGNANGEPTLIAIEVAYGQHRTVIELPGYWLNGEVGADVDLATADALDDLADALSRKAVEFRSIASRQSPPKR